MSCSGSVRQRGWRVRRDNRAASIAVSIPRPLESKGASGVLDSGLLVFWRLREALYARSGICIGNPDSVNLDLWRYASLKWKNKGKKVHRIEVAYGCSFLSHSAGKSALSLFRGS